MGKRACLFYLFLAVTGWSAALHAEPRVEAFAMVVANNRSLDRTQQALRYADDDGARFYELLNVFASRVELLSVPDTQTQKTFGRLAKIAQPPTRARLRRAMGRLRSAILAARKTGARTVLYFYFAGHGDVGNDREGYINLLDGRFSRSDLYREVIARSPADFNHIIIDACNSYFLVKRRGGPPRRATPQEAIRSFLDRESLERYPNTGVVLSTASISETHEWSRFRSGIFSHQLLSAMWGAADINGDLLVDYREAAAYMAAANLRVKDQRARLSIYARAPSSNANLPLVDLRRLRRVGKEDSRPAPGKVASIVVIPGSMTGHHYLEDDRGVRYADFNKTVEQGLRLALLDRPYYYLRSATREALIKPGSPAEVQAGELSFEDIPLVGRGSVERSFRRDLYTFPFGRSFAAGHAAAEAAPREAALQKIVVKEGRVRASPQPWYSRAGTWKWVTAGTALATLTAGVVFQVMATHSADELDSGEGRITMTRAIELQDQIRERQTVAGVAFGVAGAAALFSTILFLMDRDDSAPSPAPASARRAAALAIWPRGGTLSLSGSF